MMNDIIYCPSHDAERRSVHCRCCADHDARHWCELEAQMLEFLLGSSHHRSFLSGLIYHLLDCINDQLR